MKPLPLAALLALLTGCTTTTNQPLPPTTTFADDLSFLKSHVDVITLQSPDKNARVAIVPAYQARVMTSTNAGDTGHSFGWINRDLISSKKLAAHINVFGGEDRFWLGPEGGPFSIFFEKDREQTLANWQTPAAIDSEPFQTVSVVSDQAIFRRVMKLKNASGATFDVEVTRTIKLLDNTSTARSLGLAAADNVNAVAYESINRIANAGQQAWRKETGLLSIWILGMFNPSDATTIIIPINDANLPTDMVTVIDDYFGKVPADRLKITKGKVFFLGDGKHRSKIGVVPAAATNTLGSYDAAHNILTLVEFSLPTNFADREYVNSKWGRQADPYIGDTVNSYNDGPPEPGAKPLGPFYELETSSPAAALSPGQSLTHTHRTIHLTGDRAALDKVARQRLGASLDK